MKRFILFGLFLIVFLDCYSVDCEEEKLSQARRFLIDGYNHLSNREYNQAVKYLQNSRRIFIELKNEEESIYADWYLLECFRGSLKFNSFHRRYDSILMNYSVEVVNKHFPNILYSKIAAEFNQELYNDAISTCNELENLTHSDSSLIRFFNTTVLSIKAQCLMKIGTFEEARTCFLNSLNFNNLETPYDSLVQSIQYLNLSKLYSDNSLYDSALISLNFAQNLCDIKNGSNYKSLADILIMTGIINNRNSQPEEALLYFRKAKQLVIGDPMTKTKQSAILFHNKANSYYLLNNFDSSIYYLSKAIQLSEKIDFNPIKGHYRSMAKLYLIKLELDSANFYYKKSLSCYHKDTVIDSHELETLIDYADFLLNHYDSIKGIKLLDSISPDRNITHFPYSLALKYYLIRGKYSFNTQDFESALKYYQNGYEIIEASMSFKHGFQLATPQSIEFYHQYSQVLSELFLTTLDSAYSYEAIKNTDNLIKLIFQLQLTSNDFKGKIFLAEKYGELINEQIALWVRINDKSGGAYTNMLSKLLNFKKFIITQGLASEHEAKAAGNIPEELLKLERILKARLSAYYLDMHGPGREFNEKERVNETQYADLAIRFDSLVNEYETHYPDYYRSKYTLPITNIDQIRNTFNDQQVLLDYSLLGDTLIILQIFEQDKHEIKLITIDDKVQKCITTIHAFMDKSTIRNCPEDVFMEYINGAHHLYMILVGNFIEDIFDKHLVVIPPGGISSIPFDILVTENNSKPSGFKNPSYLIKQVDISYEYSIASFLNNHRNNRLIDGIKVLSIFTGEENPADIDNQPPDNLSFDKEESNYLISLFSGDSYDLSQINMDSLDAFSKEYNVLHFAVHNAFREDDPLLSNIYEAQDSISSALYSIDIMNHHLDYDLLILSGCNTGMGAMIMGEGAFSNAKAFYVAGCKSQLITLNPIEDHISEQIVTLFFQNLRQGYSQSQSLRKAKLEYLENALPSASHPYYWSSFVLVGDGEGKSSLCTRYWIWPTILFSFLLLSVIFYAFRIKRQKK